MLIWLLHVVLAGKIHKQIKGVTSPGDDVYSMTSLILPQSASNTSGNPLGRGYKRGGCRTEGIIPRPAAKRNTVSTLPLLLTDLFTIIMFNLYVLGSMVSLWTLRLIILHLLYNSFTYPLEMCRAAELYGNMVPGFTYSSITILPPLFLLYFSSISCSFAFLFFFFILLSSDDCSAVGVSPIADVLSEEL